MLHFLISLAGIILTITFIVGTHESGHFVMARLAGVKVLTFSIGFGKALLRWRDKSGTEYIIGAIPLGGYVRMLDESEGSVAPADLPHSYSYQPYYKKFLIIAAGPATNFICAFLLYWLIFTLGFYTIKPIVGVVTPGSIAAKAGMQPMQQILSIDQKPVDTWTNIIFRLLRHTGDSDQASILVENTQTHKQQTLTLDLSAWEMEGLNPDPLKSLGFLPYEPPVKMEIGIIAEDSAAAKSTLKVGDKLLAVNQLPVANWKQMVEFVHSHPNQHVVIKVNRKGQTLDIPVTIGSEHNWRWEEHGVLGIAPQVDFPPDLQQRVIYSPLAAIGKSINEVSDFAYFNLMLFGKMVTGKLSMESLGGPITIFSSAGDSLNYGFLPFISFLAFLSVAIGLINVFPIPGLDGGHLFLQTVEAIARRKIPDRVTHFLYRMGFLFILLVMAQAMLNDVLRMFW